MDPICLPGHVIQTALLPVTDQEHSRILIMLMNDQKVNMTFLHYIVVTWARVVCLIYTPKARGL